MSRATLRQLIARQPDARALLSDVAEALAGSPPDPMEPISPTFEETPDGRWAVLPDGTRIRIVVPLTA